MEKEKFRQYKKRAGLGAAALATTLGLGSELHDSHEHYKPHDDGREPVVGIYRKEEHDIPQSGLGMSTPDIYERPELPVTIYVKELPKHIQQDHKVR